MLYAKKKWINIDDGNSFIHSLDNTINSIKESGNLFI